MQFLLQFGGERRALEAPDEVEACREALRQGAAGILTPEGVPLEPLQVLGLDRPGLFGFFSPAWAPPSPRELREVLAVARLTGGAAARLVGVDGRTVRKWVGAEREMPYAAWRLLCIYAGLATATRMPAG